MKIERVSENKIKVTISVDDLEERDINIDSLNYNSPAAQELFWDMMEQAEVEFGFNASDAQLCIEAVPDIDEGFIVTITRIDEEGDFESIHKFIKNKYKKNDLRVKRKGNKICSAITIYSFRTFEDLCALSDRIHGIYTGDSTLYRCKDTYYLTLNKGSVAVENERLFDNLLSEYGNKVTNVSFYEGYLNEYGVKISEFTALEVINQFFN